MSGRLAAALLAALTLLAPTAPATATEERPRWDTRVFAKVGSPGFPANVYAHPDGRVYAGSYTNPLGDSIPSRVFEWSADGIPLRSWSVPGQDLSMDHGVQVSISDARGRLMLLEKSTARVLRLDRATGRFTTYATLPDVPVCLLAAGGPCSPNLVDAKPIPNFSVWGPSGELYVTDYNQAVIWRVPPGGGTPALWFRDRRLDGVKFGTAGLALSPGGTELYLAQQTSMGLGELNPTSGKLYRLPILASGAPGTMTKLWESQPGELPDGFAIARSGRIYVANAGPTNQLVVLDAQGRELERIPKVPVTGDNGSEIPFDTPSNITFRGTSVLVANQSFLGNRANHAILDVHVGETGVPIRIPRGAGGP